MVFSLLEKWFPFVIVNIVTIWSIYRNIDNNYLIVCLVVLVAFNFLFFSLYDRLNFDKFKFGLSKEGLNIVFDKAVEKFQENIDEINYEEVGVQIDRQLLKNKLSKANNITDLITMASQLTYHWTLAAVEAKQKKKQVKAFREEEEILKTKKISTALNELFKEK